MNGILDFRQVDVFCSTPFLGNPVAVVLGADVLNTGQMQRIAMWTNLSETTFILKATTPGANYRLRIFDPRHELPFAGHPTLGSARAYIDAYDGGWDGDTVVQECAQGLIPIRIAAGASQRLSLRLPQAKFLDLDERVLIQLEQGLRTNWRGRPAAVDVGPIWLIVQLASPAAVRDLVPDMGVIADLSNAARLTGITVFATDAEHVEVRSFAPASGVPEDPVCGSGNGAVAVYRSRQGHFHDYIADQGSCVGRAGRVYVTYGDNGAVWIGGDTSICIKGELRSL